MARSDDTNPLASALVALRETHRGQAVATAPKPAPEVEWFLIRSDGELIRRIDPGTRLGVNPQGELSLDGTDDPVVLDADDSGGLILRMASGQHRFQGGPDEDAAVVPLRPGSRARIDLLGNTVCIDTEIGNTATSKTERTIAVVRIPEPEDSPGVPPGVPPGGLEEAEAETPVESTELERVAQSGPADEAPALPSHSRSSEAPAADSAGEASPKPDLSAGGGRTSRYSFMLRGAAVGVIVLVGLYLYQQADRSSLPQEPAATVDVPLANSEARPAPPASAAPDESDESDELSFPDPPPDAGLPALAVAETITEETVPDPVAQPSTPEVEPAPMVIDEIAVEATTVPPATGMVAALQALQRERAAPPEVVESPSRLDGQDVAAAPTAVAAADETGADTTLEPASDDVLDQPGPAPVTPLPSEPSPDAVGATEPLLSRPQEPVAEPSETDSIPAPTATDDPVVGEASDGTSGYRETAAAQPPEGADRLDTAQALPEPIELVVAEALATAGEFADPSPVDVSEAVPVEVPEPVAQAATPDPGSAALDEGREGLYPLSALTVVRMEAPNYPRRAPPGAEASVAILFTVSETGVVQDLEVQGTPPPYFERAARRAVSRWRFEPVMKDGRAVPVRARVTVEFRS